MSLKCLVCGFEDHVEDAAYCQECGRSLINYCTNDLCDLNNGESIPIVYGAKFCPFCGSPSTFSDDGYFDEK